MLVLNLGCGTNTSPLCVNIDWAPALRIKKNPLLRVVSWPFLTSRERTRLLALADSVVVHNISRQLPYADNAVDAAYHSHVLEHIDRDHAPTFLAEIFRVLKPGGIHRACVPDFELLVRRYVASVSACQTTGTTAPAHDEAIAAILEQSVRRESAALRDVIGVRRILELLLVGDARRRGETHQWMYDRWNLQVALECVGFRECRFVSAQESQIPHFDRMGLEIDDSGRERKPDSLYVECMK